MIQLVFLVLFLLLFVQGGVDAAEGSTRHSSRSLLLLKGSNKKKNNHRRRLGVGDFYNRQTNKSKNSNTKITKYPTESPLDVSSSSSSSPTASPMISAPSFSTTSLLPTPFPTTLERKSSTPTIINDTSIQNTTIAHRTLAPFDIIMGGTANQLVDDVSAMKGSLEYFLYKRFKEEWFHLLKSVQLEEADRRRKLLSQQFSYTGTATFVLVMDGGADSSSSNATSTMIPTTEEVHDVQRIALSIYLAELQAILNDNSIFLDIDIVQFGDEKDDNGGGIIGTIQEGTGKETKDDDSLSSSTESVTATWTALVSATLMFTVGCVLFKQGRSHWISRKYGSEQCSKEAEEEEEEEEEDSESSSTPSHDMTWQVLLLRSSDTTVHQQDRMDVEESSTSIILFPKRKK